MMTPTANQLAVCIAPESMNHLPRESGGRRQADHPSAPIVNAPMVQGMRRPMPSSSLTSVLMGGGVDRRRPRRTSVILPSGVRGDVQGGADHRERRQHAPPRARRRRAGETVE